MSDTALILLAVGSSTCMGSPRQLLDFRGEPLVRYSALNAIAAGCKPVIAVVGSFENEIREALADLDIGIAVNPRWRDGMGTSIQTGLRALERREVRGAILALADQPFVTAEYLRNLTRWHEEWGCAIVASSYAGAAGAPAFFSSKIFPLLMDLRPAESCNGVILANPDEALLVNCPEAAISVDTPADYKRALALR